MGCYDEIGTVALIFWVNIKREHFIIFPLNVKNNMLNYFKNFPLLGSGKDSNGDIYCNWHY